MPSLSTRRDMLKQALLGAAGFALLDRVTPAFAEKVAAPAAVPRATSVIQIWMWGGPSHLDTFDPKPDAGTDYCGPFTTPIATKADGVRICELLPKLAGQGDKFSIIRSMTHGNNSHETASYLVQTGRVPDRTVFPGMGAVVSVFKGYERGYKGVVPPYIVLTKAQGRFSESGFLGQRYKPFVTGGDPSKPVFVVEGIVAEGITDERQRDRRTLLHSLDTLGQAMPSNTAFTALDTCENNAYTTMFGESKALFNLGTEPAAMRELYGTSKFGQSCLMARRLVERGVPYVTINYEGWDTHKRGFETMRRQLPDLDQGMAALLQDLASRGLLDRTIVWWTGEFGRTPKIQWESPWNGGRGHYGQCFSSVVAGGGFTGGRIVGSSDAKGMEVAERPVHPRDVLASMYTLMGIDPNGRLPNATGLDIPVLPPAGAQAAQGGLLKEIMPA